MIDGPAVSAFLCTLDRIANEFNLTYADRQEGRVTVHFPVTMSDNFLAQSGLVLGCKVYFSTVDTWQVAVNWESPDQKGKGVFYMTNYIYSIPAPALEFSPNKYLKGI